MISIQILAWWLNLKTIYNLITNRFQNKSKPYVFNYQGFDVMQFGRVAIEYPLTQWGFDKFKTNEIINGFDLF
jgi:hypothetical protein